MVCNIYSIGLIVEDNTNSSPNSSTTENKTPCSLRLTYNRSTRKSRIEMAEGARQENGKK